MGHETWHQADVRVGAEAYRLRVSRPRPTRYRVELEYRPCGGGRCRAVGPVRAHPRRRRPALRRALGRAGPGLPGRGRRSGAPDLRRRGRAGPRPRPGHGGGHDGRRRRRGRGRRRRGHRGEHEAGDRAARPGGRPGRRSARRRQHSGRHGRQAGQDRAGSGTAGQRRPRVRCPGRPERAGRFGRRPARPGVGRRRRAGSPALHGAGLRHRRGRGRTAAEEAGRRASRATGRRSQAAGRRDRDPADLRRHLRAVAEPPGAQRDRSRRRGRGGRRGRPQPAGVPARLPALRGRRRGGPARVVPDQAAPDPRPLRRHRTGSLARARTGAVPDLPGPPPRGHPRARRGRTAALAAARPGIAAGRRPRRTTGGSSTS